MSAQIPVASVLLGFEPYTQAQQLRVFAAELDRIGDGACPELRAEAMELAAQLDATPGPSELEMDAHEIGDRLACELDEIANRYGLSFWIDDCDVWAYRPIDSEENRAAHAGLLG